MNDHIGEVGAIATDVLFELACCPVGFGQPDRVVDGDGEEDDAPARGFEDIAVAVSDRCVATRAGG